MLSLTDTKERFLSALREQEIFSFLAAFVACLATAKFGNYVFHTWAISPAVIWAPPGIALAAVILGGYRMWFPIALAHLVFGILVAQPPAIIVISTVAYTLQALLGGYILSKFRFEPTISRTRDALAMIGLALLLPAFAPAVITAGLSLTSHLSISFWDYWSRGWAGSVLSVMVLTPLIITVMTHRVLPILKREIVETAFALALLAAAVYIVFWTALPQANVFVTLYFLFALLFWVGLRLGSRVMSLSIFIVAALGMAGSILAHPTGTAINTQVFADELFMILITPIFLILSALVEERRVTAKHLEHSITDLQQALHKLGLEDQSKNEFIATLAHELRNPLAPIVSTLEYLKFEEQKPETRQLILGAEEQTLIMRRLLDDLLDVARVTQKRFKLQEEPVALQTAVERSLHTVDLFVQSHHHKLEVRMPKEPVWVYGDPIRLTQIFTNILYNAAKYTPAGGHITLDVMEEGGQAVATVTDNGIGIELQRLARIFEPFVHTGPRKTVGTGLGIGLSLTKRLVEMHNGKILAHSQGKDMGSTFTVCLPLIPAPVATVLTDAPQISSSPTGLRILVVDDNIAAAHGIEKLLTLRGHSVQIAYDGEGALLANTRFIPHVVLLDIGLPDIDGYEVVGRLRVQERVPFIIALSGYGQEDDKNKAIIAGFNHHLTKPVDLADIEKVLASYTAVV